MLLQRLIVVSLLALLASSAAGQEGDAGQEGGRLLLLCTIRPAPAHSSTELRITLRFRGEADGETVLHLPTDRYGTPNVHEAITSVTAAGSASVVQGEEEHQRLVRHPPAGVVDVSYTIAWDPARSEGVAYSPSVSSDHFHFFGPQWLARPEGYEGAIDLRIRFAGLPKGWRALSSFGLGTGPHELTDIVLDELASFIAGGAYRVHDFECGGKPVRVGVTGAFALPDEQIHAYVQRIVCAQRQWMDDFSQPFYTVSVTPRSGIRAGTAVANAFVCLLDPEVSAMRLNILLSHEMFHNWLLVGGRVVADFDDDVPASKWAYQWMDEGFTEYFARKILYEADLLARDELVQLTNEDFEDYWRNEQRHITYAELRRAAEENRFWSTHQRIGYYRGALIALDWDTRIQQRTGGTVSLSDAIREVIRTAIDRGGHLPEDEFHAIMRRYGIDSTAAQQRYIVEGRAPPATPDAYAPDYVLGERTLHDFAPGFDITASRREGRIAGVDPEGHAHAAGLRNEMELVRMRNTRFYDPDRPLQVTVRIAGEERTIEFHPKGAPMRIPEYRPAAPQGDPDDDGAAAGALPDVHAGRRLVLRHLRRARLARVLRLSVLSEPPRDRSGCRTAAHAARACRPPHEARTASQRSSRARAPSSSRPVRTRPPLPHRMRTAPLSRSTSLGRSSSGSLNRRPPR